jgi:hypothetical protein
MRVYIVSVRYTTPSETATYLYSVHSYSNIGAELRVAAYLDRTISYWERPNFYVETAIARQSIPRVPYEL